MRSTGMGKDYYSILGVGRDATADELKKAYRKNAMKWHPDKNPDNKAQAEKKFQELSEAYQVRTSSKLFELHDRNPTRRVVRQSRDEILTFSYNVHGCYT